MANFLIPYSKLVLGEKFIHSLILDESEYVIFTSPFCISIKLLIALTPKLFSIVKVTSKN